MTEEEALQLRKENQELREALKQTQELLRVALARIEELEKQKQLLMTEAERINAQLGNRPTPDVIKALAEEAAIAFEKISSFARRAQVVPTK